MLPQPPPRPSNHGCSSFPAEVSLCLFSIDKICSFSLPSPSLSLPHPTLFFFVSLFSISTPPHTSLSRFLPFPTLIISTTPVAAVCTCFILLAASAHDQGLERLRPRRRTCRLAKNPSLRAKRRVSISSTPDPPPRSRSSMPNVWYARTSAVGSPTRPKIAPPPSNPPQQQQSPRANSPSEISPMPLSHRVPLRFPLAPDPVTPLSCRVNARGRPLRSRSPARVAIAVMIAR